MSKRFGSYTAWSGVALAVMMIIGFVMDMAIIATTGGPPILNPENIGPELLRAKGSAIWPIEAWLYTLMIVPVPAFALAVFRALRWEGDRGLPALGLIAGMAFWIFHTFHNIAFLTVLQVLVPSYPGTGGASTPAELTAKALLGFANAAFGFGTSVGGLLLVTSLVAFGAATLQTGGLPRWTGYAAVGAAALALLAYLQVVSPSLGPVFGLPSWILHIAWISGAAIAVVRGRAGARSQSVSPESGVALSGTTG